MVRRKLRITDRVEIKTADVVEDSKAILDNYGISNTDSPLVVKIAATHSGRLTRNHAFYLADKMEKSTHTWTEHYGKPMLVHHDKKGSDPIGRIVQARYIDTSGELHESIKNSLDIGELQSFINGQMPFIRQVDYICDKIANSAFLDDKDYKGLGYIELTAVISDADAKQKILDGRYLTGSISATTDKAICSICKQDWIDEGKCEHDMGELYDDVRAFIIAGEFEYEEYSYVNDPADTLSQNIELVEAPFSDKVNKGTRDSVRDAISITSHADRVMVVQSHDSLHFRYDYDVASAIRTNESNETDAGYNQAPPKDIYDLHEKLHEEAKSGDFDDSLVLGALDRALPVGLQPPVPNLGTEDSTQEKKNTMSVNDAEKNAEEGVVKTDGGTEEGKPSDTATTDVKPEDGNTEGNVQDEGNGTEITEIFTSLSDLSEEDLEAKIVDADFDDEKLSLVVGEAVYELMVREMDADEELKDKKLSLPERKSLPGSAFCAPGRSFLVHDCAHATAATRLIARTKVSDATKDKILASIARKAKSLDCVSLQKDTTAEKTDTQKVECQPCVDKQGQIDSVVTELTNLKDHLSALREEIGMLYKDYADMHDRLIQAELTTRNLKAERVADFKVLSGGKLEDRGQTVKELMELEDTVLNSEVDSVDMTKIVDKLNSGISRSPSETVSNPAQEAENQDNTTSVNVLDELPEEIRETYQHLMDSSGPVAANKMIRNAVRNGYLDSIWLEKLS